MATRIFKQSNLVTKIGQKTYKVLGNSLENCELMDKVADMSNTAYKAICKETLSEFTQLVLAIKDMSSYNKALNYFENEIDDEVLIIEDFDEDFVDLENVVDLSEVFNKINKIYTSSFFINNTITITLSDTYEGTQKSLEKIRGIFTKEGYNIANEAKRFNHITRSKRGENATYTFTLN